MLGLFNGIVVFLLGALGAAAVYYVKTQIQLAVPAKSTMEAVGARLEAIATQLMAKIDQINQALQDVNVTLARGEERFASHGREIERHDERITRLERHAGGGI